MVVVSVMLSATMVAQVPSASYALYLPSQYRADRAWPVLMAFHPAARGQAFVDLYRDVAEDYGYIIVASNVSRNGPWEPSLRAASVMAQDVSARYSIDPARVYTTGFSGGARVAMQLAMQSGGIAGVIASGAGFPDAQVRKTLSFDVTATIGLDDFNYAELRALDRGVASPHRVWYFDGGHTLPPVAVARQALEWLELRAMVRGLRPRDPAVVERWWQARLVAVEARTTPDAVATGLEQLAEDFRSVRDVAETERRAKVMLAGSDVKRALARDRDREVAETRQLTEVATLEAALQSDETRTRSLLELRRILKDVSARARATPGSPDQRSARRVLVAITSGAPERVNDAEYLVMVREFRLPRTAADLKVTPYLDRSSNSVQRCRRASRSVLVFSSAARVSAMAALPVR
jgi:hypothetical protein